MPVKCDQCLTPMMFSVIFYFLLSQRTPGTRWLTVLPSMHCCCYYSLTFLLQPIHFLLIIIPTQLILPLLIAFTPVQLLLPLIFLLPLTHHLFPFLLLSSTPLLPHSPSTFLCLLFFIIITYFPFLLALSQLCRLFFLLLIFISVFITDSSPFLTSPPLPCQLLLHHN